MPTWFRSGFVTLNTASFFSLATILVYSFDFARPHKDLFCFGYAVVLFGLGLAYLRLRQADPLYNVYITKAIAMATLGLAARYSANALSAWLAIETVVLLVSARRSGLVVTRILAFVVAGIALFHGVLTVLTMSTLAYTSPEYLARLTQSGIAVVAFFVASVFYQRTDWSTRAPAALRISDPNNLSLWRLDLVGMCPAIYPEARKPFDGLLYPYLYALGGTFLFLAFLTRLVTDGHAFLTLAAFALTMAAVATALRAKPLGMVSLIGVTAALLWGTIVLTFGIRLDGALATMAVIALALTALTSETWLVGAREGLSFHQSSSAPYFLYGVTGFLGGLALVQKLSPANGTLALGALALGFAVLFVALHPRAVAAVGAALFVWAQVRWLMQYDTVTLAQSGLPDWGKQMGAGLTVAPLLADRIFAWGKKLRADVSVLGGLLVVTAWVVLNRYAAVLTPEVWAPFWWALTAFAFLGYAGAFRSPVAAIVSALGGAIASVYNIFWAYSTPAPWASHVAALVAGFVAMAAYWFAVERVIGFASPEQRKKFAVAPEPIAVSFMVVTLLVLLERIPQISSLYLIVSWTLLAVLLFGISLPLTQKYYRYAGLAVFGLSVLRALALVIGSKDLDTIYKILATGVLGVALLGVSYGYNIAVERLRPDAPDTPADEPQAAPAGTPPPAAPGPPPIPGSHDQG